MRDIITFKNNSKLAFRTGVIFVGLIVASSILSIFATYHRIAIGQKNYITLNGIEYMRIQYPSDYATVNWLNSNVFKNPVILEAPGNPYAYQSQISTNTGLPTVIGWANHEFLWRKVWFTDRIKDVNTIYNTTDNKLSINLLNKYNVKYIFIGINERNKYSKPGLNKFEKNPTYQKVFSNGNNIIFKYKK